jgi:hypothetical protein
MAARVRNIAGGARHERAHRVDGQGLASRAHRVTSACVACASVGVLLAGPAIAQSTDVDLARLRACLSLETEPRRVECFDRVVDSSGADPRPAEVREPPSASAANRADAQRSATRTTASSATAAAAPAAPTGAPRDEVSAGPSALGDDPGEWTIVIVEIAVQRRGARFVTESGQVLIESDSGTRPVYPDVPFAATLIRRRLGGLFLKLEGNTPPFRVRSAD